MSYSSQGDEVLCESNDVSYSAYRKLPSQKSITPIHLVVFAFVVFLLFAISFSCSIAAIIGVSRRNDAQVDIVTEIIRCNRTLLNMIFNGQNLMMIDDDLSDVTTKKISSGPLQLPCRACRSTNSSVDSHNTKLGAHDVPVTASPTLAAHVAGAIVTNNEDFSEVTSWSVVQPSIERTSCASSSSCSLIIQHKNGRLVAPRVGLYFVYSQVQFLSYPRTDPQLEGHAHAQLSHSVLKWNVIYPNDGTKLIAKKSLSSRWVLNSMDSEVDEQGSYIGGLFTLQQWDQVFVRISKFGILNDTTATFFGMFSVM